MRWTLTLVGLTVFAVLAWARWWRDRHLRRGAREWAKARRERESRNVEPL